MPNPVILFRKDSSNSDELEIAKKYFKVIHNRAEFVGLESNTLIVPRYSYLPFPAELEYDAAFYGHELINNLNQHRWIADFKYYKILKEFTPETWFSAKEVVDSGYKGPFVLKGKTNSRKYNFLTHMYAKDLSALYRVDTELRNDGLIGFQDIVYRKYIPLETFDVGLNCVRYTNEWRAFFYKGSILSVNYYWSSAPDRIVNSMKDYSIKDGLMFLLKFKDIVAEYVNFWVADIAKTESGDWILVELNDATMSGLSENNPNLLYGNLKDCLYGI